MTHEEAWIDVDWGLDFASFEWMVHLAACFNRHLPPNAPWNAWPDWPTDMIGRVPEVHRPGWLSACHLVHRHPSIAVKGNTITVTDAHGTARVLEDVDVTCRWWHVDVTSDWNVPPKVVAALDARHGPSASHKFVPGQMEQICMGVEDDTLSYGLGLASVLQTMLDPVALYSRATDFHGARCTSCHGTTYRQGLRGQGLEHGKEVAYECWSCSTASWCN